MFNVGMANIIHGSLSTSGDLCEPAGGHSGPQETLLHERDGHGLQAIEVGVPGDNCTWARVVDVGRTWANPPSSMTAGTPARGAGPLGLIQRDCDLVIATR